jgi:isopentenyldiphosphate isomerase
MTEQERLELIRRAQQLPAVLPPGWTEALQDHPGLVGEQKARQEAQKRKALADLLRSQGKDLFDRTTPGVTKGVY